MKIFLPALLLISLFSENIYSQNLKPSIGIEALPSDNDSICPIPLYTGSFYTSGLQAGDTIADFTLYNLNGDSMNIKNELQKGKPVLIVAGAYTCPVFRGKVPDINNIISTYGTDISVFIIYVIEAHPDTDISPYFGFVNTTNSNTNAGILYRQPTTYGERKAIVSDMFSAMSIDAPVFIDGPCNNWWEYFGPAPNNSYLIDTNGVVFTKHGWFHKYPDDIFCDIDSLLGTSGNCGGSANNGQFTFAMSGNNTGTGLPSSTITVVGELKNNSSKNVLIEIKRLQKNLPSGWESSMCADICLAPDIDSTTVLLAAGDSQSFTIYFYTDNTIDTGMVRIGFRNTEDMSNAFNQYFYGITSNSVNIKKPKTQQIASFVFPNPFSTSATLYFEENNFKNELFIYDLFGRELRKMKIQNPIVTIERGNLAEGIYFYAVKNSNSTISFGKFIVD